MLWLCRECGIEVRANDDLAATWIGWTALDGDTGVCPTCGGGAARFAPGARLRDATRHRQRSDRALTASRVLVHRARPIWDETALEAAADRLGYVPELCSRCRSSSEHACDLCEGAGIVWRRGDACLTGAGLLRLAMWPERE